MEVENNQSVLIIKGQVNTITDVHDLKDLLYGLKEEKNISVVFQDADFIPSSLLGTFLKLVKIDNIQLKIEVKSRETADMLTHLGLGEILDISVYRP